MSDSATTPIRFGTPTDLGLEAAFDGGRLTSDGGLPWLSEADRELGLCGALAARVRARLLENDPRCWAATWDAMAGFDARSQLGQLEQPTLVVAGAEDVSTPPSVAEELASALPRAHLHVEPGASHLAPLEHPDRYTRLVSDFLAPSWAPAGAS